MFEPHYPVYRGKRALTVEVLAAEDNEVCGHYSGVRVRVVHCDARVVVYTATTAAARAPRVNVGKPVEQKEQK